VTCQRGQAQVACPLLYAPAVAGERKRSRHEFRVTLTLILSLRERKSTERGLHSSWEGMHVAYCLRSRGDR
jgi:hypothetical protein